MLESILLGLCLLAVVLVVAIYVTLAPWHRTLTGKAVVVMLAALGVLIAEAFLFKLFGDYPERPWLRCGALGLLLCALVGLGKTIVDEQFSGWVYRQHENDKEMQDS